MICFRRPGSRLFNVLLKFGLENNFIFVIIVYLFRYVKALEAIGKAR